MAEKSGDIRVLTTELVKRMNEDLRRIRILEQRVDKIENNFNDIQGSLMAQAEDLKIGLSRIGDKVITFSDRITQIETDLARLNKELQKTASRTELKQVESFIDLLNPITSKFVTKGEMERALEDRLKRRA